MIYIGIDVSKHKFDIAWLRDASRGKVKTKTFKNQVSNFGPIGDWRVNKTGASPESILITVEPTSTYHENLIHHLHDQGFQIFLANPGNARKHAQAMGSTHKTDKADSVMLARFGMHQDSAGNLTLWEPEPPEARHLQDMLRRLDALEQDRQRQLNQREAYEQAGSSASVLDSIDRIIAAFDQAIDELRAAIDDHIDKHPQLKHNRELIKSIQGVGDVTARELTSLFAAKQFRNARQASAYLGLIPGQAESGQFKGQTRLTKTGPSRIRAKLYMAAVAAGTHNPDIRAQKLRLRGQGKTPMQALGAAMRKLVQICFGVVQHQQVYQPQVAT